MKYLTRFLLAVLVPLALCAQTATVTKTPGTNLIKESLVIGTGKTLTATGTGTIVATSTAGPVNGTVGATTPTTGAFTTGTFSGNVTAPDYLLGTAGPSVKSSLAARAAAQRTVLDGTAGAVSTLPVTTITDMTLCLDLSIPITPVDGFPIFSISSHATDARQAGGFFMDTSSGHLRIYLYGSAGSRNTRILNFYTLFAGQDVQLTIVKSANTIVVYGNGIALTQAAESTSGTPPAWSDNITGPYALIGRDGSYFWTGACAVVGLSTRALSAPEILDVFRRGTFPSTDYQYAGSKALNTSVIANTGYAYGTFTGASASGFTAANGAALAIALCSPPAWVATPLTPGQQIKVTFHADLTSGEAPTTVLGTTGAWGSASAEHTITNGDNSVIFTATAGSNRLMFYTGGATSYAISSLSVSPIGVVLANDPKQPGQGTIWAPKQGTLAETTLSNGVRWALPSAFVAPVKVNQIYAMGDSLTVQGGFLTKLKSLLGRDWNTVNCGIGGTTTAEMVARFANEVATAGDANTVIVWGGINSVNSDVSAATIEGELQTMFTAAKALGAKVVAMTITPYKGDAVHWSAGRQVILEAVNTWIKGTASDVDVVLDAYALMEDPGNADYLLPAYAEVDGIHISPAGHVILGSALYAAASWVPAGAAPVVEVSLAGVKLNQDLQTMDAPTFRGLTILRTSLFSGTGAHVFGTTDTVTLAAGVATATGKIVAPSYATTNSKVMTNNNNAVAIFEVACAASGMVGGSIHYTMIATDGTDFQTHSGFANYSVVNDAGGGTTTVTINEVAQAETTAATTGTITSTWTITAGTDKATINVAGTSSLTETAKSVKFTILNHTNSAITML
jgi:lysophospholipase L1-like esterase